jgi:dolichol-phosphate mannosyltransferase
VPEPGCRVSVVTPAYDELANLRELLPRLRRVLESEPDLDAEVLVVLPAWAPRMEQDEVIALGGRPVLRSPTDSFGDALRSGFAAARDDSKYVITLDADGSHDPETIRAMLAAAPTAQVVIGSRYVAGGATDNSFVLRLMSKSLNAVYGRVLGITCKDISTNYKLYRRDDLRRISLRCRDFDVVEEIMFRIKDLHGRSFKVVEVPDHFHERKHGVTKRRLGPFVVSYVVTLIRLRWQSRGRSRP